MKHHYSKLLVVLLALSLTAVMTACGAKTTEREVGQTTATGATADASPSTTNTDLFTERDLDPSYDEATTIDLSKESGSTVTIEEAGTYVLKGTYDGQIVVKAGDKDKVQLVLDGVTLTNSKSAAIYVQNADKVFLTLADGKENTITCTAPLSDKDAETGDKVDGAVFSKDTLVLNGSGTLSVQCENGHGIVSKDDLKVTGGTLNVQAAKKTLSANDSVRIGAGTLTLNAGTEGIESKEIYLVGGDLDITAKDDGINAADGDSTAEIRDSQSALLEIRGGTITVDAGGDGLDSNGTMKVSGGTTYVSGSTNGGNGAIDCDNATITGGTVIAASAAGMDVNFGEDSTQCSMLVRFDSTVRGGTGVVLKDSDGKTILSFTPTKDYQSVVLSSGDIRTGETYTLTAGDQSQEVEMTETIYGTGSQMGGPGGFGRIQGEPGGQRPDGSGSYGDFGGRPGENSEGERPDTQSSATQTA